MTDQSNLETSLFELRASSPRGAQGLAAARLATRIARLLGEARIAAGLSNRDLAARLNVTEGRVSQVVSGDGNVHVATLARFMNAMGYEVEVNAVPIKPGLKKIWGTLTRRVRGRSIGPHLLGSDYDIYEQSFVTGHGPMDIPMFVPTDDVLGCAPEGQPRHVGRVTISEGRVTAISRRVSPHSAWQASQSRSVGV